MTKNTSPCRWIIAACALLLLVTTVNAQTELPTYEDAEHVPPDDYTVLVDHVLEHVDISQATTGILLDKALPLGKPGIYNGTLNMDKSMLMPIMRFTYGSLYTGQTGTQEPLPDITILDKISEEWTDHNIVPIMLMAINYNQFKATAIDDRLLYQGEKKELYDVPDREESAYETHTCYMAAPVEYVLSADEGHPVSFVLPHDLLINTTGQPIKYIEVDAADGLGYRVIEPDEVFEAVYTEDGIYTMQFRLSLENGVVYEIGAGISFAKKGRYTAPDYSEPVNATRAYAGIKGSATISIRYGCGNTQLRKPIVVVEGWDPPQKSKLGLESYNFGQFIKDINNSNSTILGKLLDESYDIVFVDFADGADYIQRNAYVVEEVLNWVNTHKSKDAEQTVVLGVSMGGLVARYALADMEKRNEKHDARTFITLDSPHQGANFPLGLQCLIRDLMHNKRTMGEYAKKYLPKELKIADEILNTPATQQMLIYQAKVNTSTGVIWADFSPSDYTGFYADLTGLGNGGYPQLTRNLAISDGSDNALGQTNFPYNAPLVSFGYGTQIISQLPSWAQILTGLAWTSGVLSPIALIVASAEAKVEVEARALPNTNDGKKVVYAFNASITALWGAIDYTEDRTISVNGTKPYDNCPGGYMPSKNFADIIKQKYFTFVPSVSSLDIKYPYNQNLFYNIAANNVVVNNQTYFKDYDHAVSSVEPENPYNNAHASLNFTDFQNTNMRLLSLETVGITSLPKNTILSGYYNLGRGTKLVATGSKLSSITVSGVNGYLGININSKIGDNSFPITELPQPNSTFTAYVEGGTCTSGSGALNISNNGLVELGSVTNNLSGNLVFGEGMVLNITSNGRLVVNNHSKVIFQAGAKLNIISGTPSIVLNGSDAMIEIQDGAVLNIPAGATFAPTGSGFVRFTGGNGTTNITTGGGSISITGSGATDKVLEFVSSASGNQIHFAALQNVEVANGQINSVCNVSFPMPLSLTGVTYAGGGNYCTNAVSIYNCSVSSSFNCIKMSAGADISINWSTFNGGNTFTAAYYNNPMVQIANNIFTGGGTNGPATLHFIDCTFDLEYNHLVDNGIGIKAEYMSNGDRVYQSKFDGTPGTYISQGIDYSGGSTSSLHVDCTDILNMQTSGVQMEGGALYARCGNIKANGQAGSAIALKTGSSLILDPAIEAGMGNVDLSGYPLTISATNAATIMVNNARSNLSSSGDAFAGNITARLPKLDAISNYWKWGVSPTRVNHYYWFYDASGQFNDAGSHKVNGANYLTSAPNIVAACPDRNLAFSRAAPVSKKGNTHTTAIFEKADNIPYVNGRTLKEAVESVFTDDIDTTLSGMETQLNDQEDLLKHSFGVYTDKATPVIDIVYSRMQQTIGKGLKYGIIERIPTSAHINKLISVQDTLLSRAPLADTNTRFTLIKDKALAYRLSDRKEQALSFLREAYLLADSTNRIFIEKWQCFIEAEMLLRDSIISAEQFLTLVKQCGMDNASKYYGKRSIDEDTTPNNQTITNGIDKSVVSIYPNPTYDHLTISLANVENETQFNIQIVDVTGRVMQAKIYQMDEGNNVLSIPLALLSGTYFIKVDGNKTHEIKRFVVIK